ncbi:uncharacterized protein JN550_011869 [Neoarthrinium moseri]|uniref:uncharacterized protein n=1 Tax=Neoarthrinium moseri TaxID=1658444 RepID=UPI001FDD8D18|nr:uncharacterized protein JN550_011869 [Neoarthrinium moseri]KAI1859674.1 hypothetical protein JN550_011869 [Neoarthrinium moseri]
MFQSLQYASVFLAFSSFAVAAETGRRAKCTVKVVRKPWDMLTSKERSAYIDAELCLMAAPSQLNIPGTETRWDDLHWNHIVQANFIHDVGQFLPWHRYYIAIHGDLLRNECGYTGPLPYWDETADSALPSSESASIFQPDAFGGNGVGSGPQKYIADGPFANSTLHLKRLGVAPADYKIYRDLNARTLIGGAQATIDACFQISTYTAAWECWAGLPHSSGHGATGGLMVDVVLSPGDPVFYLHHGWLDAMWWKWQSLDLPNRLKDMGGRNIPRESYVGNIGLPLPGPEWTNHDGDDGSVTTLNHVLYMSDMYPNVTVADVMDVRGDVVCAEYFYNDSFTFTMSRIVDGIIVFDTIIS